MSKNQTDNLKLLKFIVHFMGVLLIGGIILLFVLVFQRNQERKETAENSDTCPNQEYVLPEEGEIKTFNYDNNTLTIMLETNNDGEQQQKIYIVDLCKYEVKHKISVKQ